MTRFSFAAGASGRPLWRASAEGTRPRMPGARSGPIETLESRTLLTTFTVTTTDDAGPGSLRQAILDANATPGRDEVRFRIPGEGVHTIRPSGLPDVTDPVSIDGKTQPGYTDTPLVELVDGLIVRTSDSLVSGLAITRLGGRGIIVPEGRGNTFTRNVFSNGAAIDLGGDGGTANDLLDADDGANRLQNYPVVDWATRWPGFGTTAGFSLNSRPNRAYRVEFFRSGQYAGASGVTTGADGNAAGVVYLAGTDPTFGYVTATATDLATGDTSEMTPPRIRPFVMRVVARHYFYNNSAFDGFDPGINADDDNAIAPDKVAAPPVGTIVPSQPSLANYTTYSKGINGVMLDIVDFGDFVPTPAEFRTEFQSTRTVPAPPAAVAVRRGAGVGGSDRVTLTWPDGQLTDGWLKVYMPGRLGFGGGTFGNLAGDVGGTRVTQPAPRFPIARAYTVNALDLAAMRARLASGPGPATITSPYDLNRDGRVDALDLAVVRQNLGSTLNEYFFTLLG